MPRRKSSRPNQGTAWRTGGHGYAAVIKRPLQILAFLLPLIIAYELALSFVLQDPDKIRTVLAHRFLLKFFDAFNVAPQVALHMGGIAIVMVLLIWHVLNRDPWRIDFKSLGYMAAECLALTLPLLTIGQLVSKAVLTNATLASEDLAALDMSSKMAISVGAGLYEELMFRMLLIAAIHTLLVDMGKASNNVGAGIAIAVSALAFALYHPLREASGSISIHKLLFYILAGVFFGIVYVTRGFGIVVGVHALYDIVTVAMLTPGD